MNMSLVLNPSPDVQRAPQSGAAGAEVFKAGQIIEARVAQVLAKGLAQLDLGGAAIVVKPQVALKPGQQLTVQVELSKGDVRFVILNNTRSEAAANPKTSGLANASERPVATARMPRPAMKAAPLRGRGEAAPPRLEISWKGDGAAQSIRAQGSKVAAASREALPRVAARAVAGGGESMMSSAQALQRAVSAAVQKAITMQGSLSGVFAEAGQMVQHLDKPLPAGVQKALGHLLGLRLSTGGRIAPGDIKQAFSRSGLFLENRLAGRAAGGGGVQADLKSALLKLQGALQGWLGEKTRPPLPPENKFQPPFRQGLPRGQPPRPPALEPASPLSEAGRILLGQTRAALSRLTLLQAASTSHHGEGAAQRPAPEWNFEIPLRLGAETAIAQLRIEGEEGGGGQAGGRRWSIHVSLDFPATGPVHAVLGLSGKSMRISLWAIREETLAMFRSQKEKLVQALEDNGLDAGNIAFRRGAPGGQAPRPGSMMDQFR